jgi:hypothetical protein
MSISIDLLWFDGLLLLLLLPSSCSRTSKHEAKKNSCSSTMRLPINLVFNHFSLSRSLLYDSVAAAVRGEWRASDAT